MPLFLISTSCQSELALQLNLTHNHLGSLPRFSLREFLDLEEALLNVGFLLSNSVSVNFTTIHNPLFKSEAIIKQFYIDRVFLLLAFPSTF